MALFKRKISGSGSSHRHLKHEAHHSGSARLAVDNLPLHHIKSTEDYSPPPSPSTTNPHFLIMSRKIKTGTYIIRSLAVRDGCIGRSKKEVQDLAPKKVYSLPAHHDVQQFVVEAVDGGRYQLWAGSPTGTVDGNLSAILQSSSAPEEWNIVYHPQYKAYTIETANRDRGWVVPSKEGYVQVAVRTPTKVQSRYPENELFTFEAMQPHWHDEC